MNASWIGETGQAIDPGNLAWWQQQFAAGYTLSSLQGALAYSWAPTVTAINNVYENVLGRPVDSPALAAVQANFAAGGTLQQLIISTAYSPESAADVQNNGSGFASLPGYNNQLIPNTTISAEESLLVSGGNHEEISANLEAIAIDAQASSFAAQFLNFIIPSASATPTNSAKVTAFFDAVDAPLSALASSYGIPSSWLLGLAAYESGYLDPHNTSLHNPLGLTAAGGNNQTFSSYSQAISQFDAIY